MTASWLRLPGRRPRQDAEAAFDMQRDNTLMIHVRIHAAIIWLVQRDLISQLRIKFAASSRFILSPSLHRLVSVVACGAHGKYA